MRNTRFLAKRVQAIFSNCDLPLAAATYKYTQNFHDCNQRQRATLMHDSGTLHRHRKKAPCSIFPLCDRIVLLINGVECYAMADC